MGPTYRIDSALLSTVRIYGGSYALCNALRTLLGEVITESALLDFLGEKGLGDAYSDGWAGLLRASLLAVQEGQRLTEQALRRHRSGSVGDAIILYKQALRTAPSPKTYLLLGWAYSFQNHYDLAIRQCELAIQLEPEWPDPYHDIGVYLIAMQEPAEAIPWLEKAAAQASHRKFFRVWADMGRAYEDMGVESRAFDSYFRAWELNPEDGYAQKAMQRLSEGQGGMN